MPRVLVSDGHVVVAAHLRDEHEVARGLAAAHPALVKAEPGLPVPLEVEQVKLVLVDLLLVALQRVLGVHFKT